MNQDIIVRGAPQEYICKVGVWNDLESHMLKRNYQKVLVVHGTTSWEAVKSSFPRLEQVIAVFEAYQEEVTYAERNRIAQISREEKVDVIIGVGGGKVADLVKAVAYDEKLPVVILPTLAATCAAYTPLSVMYDEAGAMEGYDVYPVANALVLVDPEILLHSPKDLMIAGIGDTLAKWYEADAIISQLEKRPVSIEVAHWAAATCRENLLKHSTAALEAMEQKVMNHSFKTIVETNILLAGMVGGFGDDYGRVAGAHSIHDAMTIIPAAHHQLHGNKVAYGVLVQLVLENKFTEIERLMPFYLQLNLPTCLSDMELSDLTEEMLQAVAEKATAEDETIHAMAGEMTAEKVYQAFVDLEKWMAVRKNSVSVRDK